MNLHDVPWGGGSLLRRRLRALTLSGCDDIHNLSCLSSCPALQQMVLIHSTGVDDACLCACAVAAGCPALRCPFCPTAEC